MQPLDPAQPPQRFPLHGSVATRQLEADAAAQLPPHTLMHRAGQAIHRLGRALAPHAQRVWVACGPGNNGGDGLLAAALWQATQPHTQVTVTWLGNEQRLPPDARDALNRARAVGVRFADTPPDGADCCIDALLGLGVQRAPTGPMAHWIERLQTSTAPVLCVDLPSGLNPDNGAWHPSVPALPTGPRHTLSLLTLKPGLFSGAGREATGGLWFDDLGVDTATTPPDAWLYSPHDTPGTVPRARRHNAHKGQHGDVLVLGGQDVAHNGQGMTGAALLAARAALAAGAGRVFVGLLGAGTHPTLAVDPWQPELMLRATGSLTQNDVLGRATTVCGCGGGQAVHTVLPPVLAHAARLVLDADGLNAIAQEPAWQTQLALRQQRRQATVLTPHPTEAARLLGTDTAAVQGDRLGAVRTLADRFQCVVVLKGSGTLVAAPGTQPVLIGSGNALLATAGTGDVLAGLIGAHIGLVDAAAGVLPATLRAVHQHGLTASRWPAQHPFNASALLSAIPPG